MKNPLLISNTITAVVVALIMLLLLHTCNKQVDPLTPESPGITLIKEVHDTIWPDTTKIWIFKDRPVIVNHYSKIPYKDTVALDSLRKLCEYQRAYLDSFSDSNLTIYSRLKVTGMLDSNKLSYRLKIPKVINNSYYYSVDPTFELYGGFAVGGNKTSVSLSPLIGARLKQNYIHYSYDLVGRSHQVGFSHTLYSKKPKIAIK